MNKSQSCNFCQQTTDKKELIIISEWLWDCDARAQAQQSTNDNETILMESTKVKFIFFGEWRGFW